MLQRDAATIGFLELSPHAQNNNCMLNWNLPRSGTPIITYNRIQNFCCDRNILFLFWSQFKSTRLVKCHSEKTRPNKVGVKKTTKDFLSHRFL
jgi:hypothetical protein